MRAIKLVKHTVPPRSCALVRRGKTHPGWVRLWRYRWVYLLIFPGFLYILIFHYFPLWGNIAAFQDFSPYRGYSRSPWVGWGNFLELISTPDIGYILWNTILLNLLQIIFAFPIAIVLALMLNALVQRRLRRLMQSIICIPHFLGWVILLSIWHQFFGGEGIINHFIHFFGGQPINFLSNSDFFRPMLILQVIWRESGWGTIIFLAALSGIDPELYEASIIDGANGWQRLYRITLPGLRQIIIVLLILRIGNILDSGFEQIFLQMQGVDIRVAQTIDIFSYVRGIQSGQWGLTTALGLVKTAVGTLLILITNRVVKWTGEEGLI